MKKCFLILLAVCAIQSSYSQTEKGKMFIGGQLNLSSNLNSSLDILSKSDNNSFGINISPNFGYFIADNFAIGANINLGTSSSTQNKEYTSATLPSKYTFKSTSISLGLGGFARYYINISDNFKFYFNGGVNYLYSTQKITNSNNDPNYIYSSGNPASEEYQTNTLSLAVSPGLAYYITPKIGIQTSFGNINYQCELRVESQ